MKYSQLKSINIIDISLGKDHLKELVNKDSYFRKTIICLDGDARTKRKLDNDKALNQSKMTFEQGLRTVKPGPDNIVLLPTFYPPEVYVYKIVKEFANDPLTYQKFWMSVENNEELSLYTSERVKRRFCLDREIRFSDIHGTKSTLNEGSKLSIKDRKELFNDIT